MPAVSHVLFLFLDGIGLGEPDPAANPFAAARLPNLRGLLGGRALVAGTPAAEGDRAIFVPTDANLGVPGPPQSATGQATILTGENIPARLGRHWGPKPNAAIASRLRAGNLFADVAGRGLSAALLNAYPDRYFHAIASGRRSYSAVALAVTAAGLPLATAAHLRAGDALSADLTGDGWPEPGQTPISLAQAGQRLAELAGRHAFCFFEFWLTDYLGHRGTLAEAVALLDRFDEAFGALLDAWDDRAGLIVLTSDHGNLEDLTHRHHTRNLVPTLIVGDQRHAFAEGLTDLTHFAPAVTRVLS
jgi:hypothetical protein